MDILHQIKRQNIPIKIMLVDDSLIIRGALARFIKEDPDLEIVFSASNALIAIEYIKINPVDVILLDVEMPQLSGIDAIAKFLSIKPDVRIIMVSTLTAQNAATTLKALSLGASDYIEKPSAHIDNSQSLFKEKILEKIKILGMASKNINITKVKINTEENSIVNTDIKLRSDRVLNFFPDVIAIASSTGGPKTITDLFMKFKKEYLMKTTVLVTQHMPSFFTRLFAEKINELGVIECAEAIDGEEIKLGKMYIAPGGLHLLVKNYAGRKVISLNNGEPVNFCKPSADPMLATISEIYKSKTLLLVLTGMGSDGLEGAKKVVASGGVVIAQDQASSVVWGMPGSVALNNLCSEILPISVMADYIMRKGL